MLMKVLEQVRVLAPNYADVVRAVDGLAFENRGKMAAYLAACEVFEGDNDPYSLACICREGIAELTKGGAVISPDGRKALETAAFKIVIALAYARIEAEEAGAEAQES
jgi:hypothetical protein